MATEYLGERGIREREEAEGEDGRRRQGAGLRVDGGDKADEGAVGVAKLVREQRSSGCSCWLLRARTATAAGGRTRPGPREEEARGAGAARGRAFALPSKEAAGSRGSFGAGSGWWDWIGGNEEIPRKKGRWVAAARE